MKNFVLALIATVVFPTLVLAGGFMTSPFVTNATPTSVDICFHSDELATAAVLYGATDDYGLEVAVNGELYEALWGEYPLFQDPVYELVDRYAYCARIDGLEPDTLYHYSVLLGTDESPDSVFATAPPVGSPFVFAVYGDSRSDPLYPLGTPNIFHENVVRQMARHPFDFILNIGDIVHDGYDVHLWEIAMEEVAPISSEVAYYPIFGNHEDRNEEGVRGENVFSMLFSNPGEASGSNNELYYSFDHGNAHFTVLDTNTDIDPESVQGQWLRADLETATADENIHWKFLLFHHPPYSASLVGIGDERSRVTKQYIPPIAEEFAVDIVFAGHQHSYERSFKKGVYYIVSGNAGALPSFFEAPVLNPYGQFFEGNPDFRHFGFCVLDVTADYLSLRSIIADGTVIDTLEIDKTPADDDDDDDDDNNDNDDDNNDDNDDDDDDDDDTGHGSTGDDDDDNNDGACGC
ncbi:MAG: metallophosphoesterase family protein [Candidatus Lernaella stagnicola]|nr:metallophosphoesterase family protein [Candidatus Lernaella stagnicola]